MDILKYISFSFLENICQKSRSAYRGKTQKFKVRVRFISNITYNSCFSYVGYINYISCFSYVIYIGYISYFSYLSQKEKHF